MTDVNGVPIINDAPPEKSVAIITIPVELARDQEVFEVKLRVPGIVRAVGFWLKEPKVLGAINMRKAEVIPQPALFVECDPNSEEKVLRRFAFIASDRKLPIHDGYQVTYVGTAIRANEVGHLFEIREVPS
ncbi:MAG: hypothetical protein HOV80_36175 [Polyangiaceae bacterium]|nr:hypothetical protein [Polyangiaceae bacterium]